MTDKPSILEIMELTTEIVTAHVGNNTVDPDTLPQIIQDVYRVMATIGGAEEEAETLRPAVPIKKSVFADYIICLEDGKKLKMLKRHLKTAFNMTPEEYRDKWGLSVEYPMVAPNYAEHRSTLAKKIGLGKKRGKG
jgi:predicted transcriptional regulator